MRALTLIRPMAAAIVHGTKRIENRPRDLPKNMRGTPTVVAVHAGKKWDADYQGKVLEIDGVARVVYPDNAHAEGIVGLMLLTGRVFTENPKPRTLMKNGKVITDDDRCLCPRYCDLHTDGNYPVWVGGDPWWSGPFGYEIAAAIAFPGPIPCRGALGFWSVPDAIEAAISDSGAIDDLVARGFASGHGSRLASAGFLPA